MSFEKKISMNLLGKLKKKNVIGQLQPSVQSPEEVS
jgi:hypothetical protein